MKIKKTSHIIVSLIMTTAFIMFFALHTFRMNIELIILYILVATLYLMLLYANYKAYQIRKIIFLKSLLVNKDTEKIIEFIKNYSLFETIMFANNIDRLQDLENILIEYFFDQKQQGISDKKIKADFQKIVPFHCKDDWNHIDLLIEAADNWEAQLSRQPSLKLKENNK